MGPSAQRGREVSGILFPHCFGGMNRHFQAKRAKYSNVHMMKITAWIPSKFCKPVKTNKYALWVVQKRGTQIQDGSLLVSACPFKHAHILVMSRI